MEPKDFIKAGIIKMLDTDRKTSPRRDLLETSERNITAHLRGCLVDVGHKHEGKEYQIDHEYNRQGMGEISKNIKTECLERKTDRVVPDILVHLRGVEIEENQNANWLVIEVKKMPEFWGIVNNIEDMGKKRDLECDLQKLSCFREDDRFKYKHAASVIFSNDEKIWISLDGNIKDNKFELLELI